MACGAVEGPEKDLENPRRYPNFSDAEIVLSVAKPNEQFAVLLAGDDGLVGWTRRGAGRGNLLRDSVAVIARSMNTFVRPRSVSFSLADLYGKCFDAPDFQSG